MTHAGCCIEATERDRGRLLQISLSPDRPYQEPMYRINTVDRAALAGLAVGTVLGIASGTGYMVSGAAQSNFTSPGFGVATLGGLAGMGVGLGVVTVLAIAYSDDQPEETTGVVVGILANAAMLGGPSLGAVIADRLWAHPPMGLTMEPLHLGPGLEGARLSLRF